MHPTSLDETLLNEVETLNKGEEVINFGANNTSLPEFYNNTARIDIRIERPNFKNGFHKGYVSGVCPTFEITFNNIHKVFAITLFFETGNDLIKEKKLDIESTKKLLDSMINFTTLRVEFYKYGELRLREYIDIDEETGLFRDYYDLKNYDKAIFTLLADH